MKSRPFQGRQMKSRPFPGRHMKSLLLAILTASIFLGTRVVAPAQTTAPTIDGYLEKAKAAAGTDWAGTFVRMCIPPPAGAARPPLPGGTRDHPCA